MRTSAQRALAFVTYTYTLSWSIWVGLIAAARLGVVAANAPGSFYALGGAAPSLVAFGLTWTEGGRKGTVRLAKSVLEWRVPLRWYAFALGMPVLLRLIAIAGYRANGGRSLPMSMGLLAIVAVFAVGLVVPLMEEYGWRGYLQPALANHRTPLQASCLVGLAWACWHIPLFWIPGTGFARWAELSGFPLALSGFLISVIGLALLFGLLYYRTKGKLLLAFLMHDAVNTSADVLSAPYSQAGLLGPIWWFVLVAALAGILAAWLLHREPSVSAISYKNASSRPR